MRTQPAQDRPRGGPRPFGTTPDESPQLQGKSLGTLCALLRELADEGKLGNTARLRPLADQVQGLALQVQPVERSRHMTFASGRVAEVIRYKFGEVVATLTGPDGALLNRKSRPPFIVQTPDRTISDLQEVEKLCCSISTNRVEPNVVAERARSLARRLEGRTSERASRPAVRGATSEPAVSVSDDALLSPTKLAEIFGAPAEALRNRLIRWRGKNLDGWVENTGRGPREAKYLYRVGAVRPVVDALKAISEATSERPAKKS